MARRATVITQQRKQNPNLLLLDAGDSLVGDQDPARKTGGQTSVEALNRLGYDAVALGPADLSLGVETLRQRASEAKFALLSANAVITGTDQLVAAPYLLREIAGHRLAIIGVSGGPGAADIGVTDPLAAVRRNLAGLQGRADIVLLLSHAGAEVDQRIADEIPGIAAIISGGAPPLAAPWRSERTGTLVFRADAAAPGHAGRYLGAGVLEFAADGKLTGQTWQRLVLGPDVAESADMAAWAQGISQ